MSFRTTTVLACLLACALSVPILYRLFTDPLGSPASSLWHVVAVWVVVAYCLPRLPDLLQRLSKVSLFGFSVELQATSGKLSSNTLFMYGELLTNRKAWTQAAEQFLSMRKSNVPRVKFDGLLASSQLIVRLCDAGKTLAHRTPTVPQFVADLRTAESFCCTALSYATSLPPELLNQKKAAAYYHRAIVKARLAMYDPQNTGDGDVIEDVKNAVDTDRDYLLQLTFDAELDNVLSHNRTRLTGNLSHYCFKPLQKKLTQDFLSKEI